MGKLGPAEMEELPGIAWQSRAGQGCEQGVQGSRMLCLRCHVECPSLRLGLPWPAVNTCLSLHSWRFAFYLLLNIAGVVFLYDVSCLFISSIEICLEFFKFWLLSYKTSRQF